MITSNPVVPLMPNRPQYSVFDIALFHHFGSADPRKEFQALFGVQARPFNPARRIKLWLDTSKGDDPNEPVSYDVLAIGNLGLPVYKKELMSAAEASAENIPGDYIYDAYNIAPTGAKLQLNSAAFDVNPEELATEEQAKAMVATLQSKLPTMALKYAEAVLGAGSAYVYPKDEPRRVWQIFDSVTGETVGNVGEFLFTMNKDGVGAPGHWQLGNTKLPEWFREFPQTRPTDNATEWPIPVRELQSPPEKLVLSFGSTITIQRDDLMPQGAGPANAQYSDADRQRDNETHALMLSLKKKLSL